jgi:hypothetical protein
VQTNRPQYRYNRVGIPAEVKTVQVPAAYWSDGEWKPTTAVIKFTQK